jgi:hypothetical protein
MKRRRMMIRAVNQDPCVFHGSISDFRGFGQVYSAVKEFFPLVLEMCLYPQKLLCTTMEQGSGFCMPQSLHTWFFSSFKLLLSSVLWSGFLFPLGWGFLYFMFAGFSARSEIPFP